MKLSDRQRQFGDKELGTEESEHEAQGKSHGG